MYSLAARSASRKYHFSVILCAQSRLSPRKIRAPQKHALPSLSRRAVKEEAPADRIVPGSGTCQRRSPLFLRGFNGAPGRGGWGRLARNVFKQTIKFRNPRPRGPSLSSFAARKKKERHTHTQSERKEEARGTY